MRKIKRWISEFFNPDSFNDLDTAAITSAFNDPQVRALWLHLILEDLKRINLAVDKTLLSGSEVGLLDLCARRRAYQDVLEAVLGAKRQVTQGVRHNPLGPVDVDLDRVTA